MSEHNKFCKENRRRLNLYKNKTTEKEELLKLSDEQIKAALFLLDDLTVVFEESPILKRKIALVETKIEKEKAKRKRKRAWLVQDIMGCFPAGTFGLYPPDSLKAKNLRELNDFAKTITGSSLDKIYKKNSKVSHLKFAIKKDVFEVF